MTQTESAGILLSVVTKSLPLKEIVLNILDKYYIRILILELNEQTTHG